MFTAPKYLGSGNEDFRTCIPLAVYCVKLVVCDRRVANKVNFVLDNLSNKSYNTTPAEEEKPLRWKLLPCSQRLMTTWIDHAVLVLTDHIFGLGIFGLTTPCFVLLFFLLRLLPSSGWLDRFLGDHICIFGVRVLTTSLTIVRCGLRGDSSTREHENARFS